MAKSILKNCFFEKKLYEIVEDYDVIQTTEYDQIANVKLKKKVKNKLIIYHGPYESKFTKNYNKKCILSDLYYLLHKDYKNTQCLAKSKLAADFLRKKGFSNVTIIGVGLDTDKFKNVKEPSNRIKKLIYDKKVQNLKYLLYIGILEKRRNIFFIIDVLKDTIKINKDFRLIIVGKGNKEYVNKCFEYAKQNNVDDKIIYYESIKQEELPNIYKNCDVFLLPTQYEIFGMVLLESIYFGLPVITTLNGGSSYLIDKEKKCNICSLDDLEIWKNQIFKAIESGNIIDNNKYILWDNLVNKIIEVYSEVNVK